MIKSLLLLASVCCGRQISSLLPSTSEAFQRWKVEHSKQYVSPNHESDAYMNYVRNEKIIADLNENPDDSAEYGHTRFSDLSPSQFRSQFLQQLTMGGDDGVSGAPNVIRNVADDHDIPSSYDWRDLNGTTPVKDQGACGSCWAFSAVQNIESVHYLSNPSVSSGPVMLSPEQVIECDPYDYACYGGYPKGAYQYVMDQGGLSLESDYPYDVDGHTICLANQTFNETCGDGMCDDPPLTSWCDVTCSASQKPFEVKIKSWSALSSDESDIAAYLSQNNPLSVALDASGGILIAWLQFYKRGIANPRRCSTTALDHAVLLVGYGVEHDTNYWTVKNSWGAKWGEDGYFRLVRGEGKCGINTMVTTAHV